MDPATRAEHPERLWFVEPVAGESVGLTIVTVDDGASQAAPGIFH